MCRRSHHLGNQLGVKRPCGHAALELASRGIVMCIARPKRLMRGTLELGGLVEEIGRDRIFVTVKSAVRAYRLEKAAQRAAARAAAAAAPPPGEGSEVR